MTYFHRVGEVVL